MLEDRHKDADAGVELCASTCAEPDDRLVIHGLRVIAAAIPPEQRLIVLTDVVWLAIRLRIDPGSLGDRTQSGDVLQGLALARRAIDWDAYAVGDVTDPLVLRWRHIRLIAATTAWGAFSYSRLIRRDLLVENETAVAIQNTLDLSTYSGPRYFVHVVAKLANGALTPEALVGPKGTAALALMVETIVADLRSGEGLYTWIKVENPTPERAAWGRVLAVRFSNPLNAGFPE